MKYFVNPLLLAFVPATKQKRRKPLQSRVLARDTSPGPWRSRACWSGCRDYSERGSRACAAPIAASFTLVRFADAIVIARGDVERTRSQERADLPCCSAGEPVIVAAQMLDSMIDARPTRAEASDVATASQDRTDAIMLSADSATELYPREAVEMMSRIIGHRTAKTVSFHSRTLLSSGE